MATVGTLDGGHGVLFTIYITLFPRKGGFAWFNWIRFWYGAGFGNCIRLALK